MLTVELFIQGHPTTVFCKISVREVNIAYNFILLEDSKNL